jgi:hypothetical protein
MTWHSFFDLSSTEHRHLVAVYGVVLGVQGGFFLWVIRGWLRIRRPRD